MMQDNNLKQILESGELTRLIDKRIDKLMGFTARKLTDTPTDALAVVNRKFVTLNGVTASRPTSSILGQFYFDTTLGYPVWWNGSTWVDSGGNPV